MTVRRDNEPAIRRNEESARACRSMLARLGSDHALADDLRWRIDHIERINGSLQEAVDRATLSDDLESIKRKAFFQFDRIVRRRFPRKAL